MFVRFRQTASRLQLSLVETRRVDGRVKHEHVASLGSITLLPPVADRIAFWARLHERLAKLSNRIDAAALSKILGHIHARVPMVTADEQRALQLENARIDAEQLTAIRDMTASTVVDKETLAASLAAQITDEKAAVAETDDAVKRAQGRVEAIQRGEFVEGGLGKPEDFAGILKAAGWTAADIRHARWMAASVPKEHFEEFVRETVRLVHKGERARDKQALRTVLSKHGEG